MKALIINCSPVRTGATAEIAKLVSEQLSAKYSVKSICIDDYSFSFCKGCRSCHNTAKCVMSDAIVIENMDYSFMPATIIHLIVDRKEKMIWFHVFSTVIILIAIVMKISETDYPAITLVLWYFYIWFLYGTINVKAFWLDK